jgi:ligand-binding sensor domain-containing protein
MQKTTAPKNQLVMKLYGLILICCWALIFGSTALAQSFGIQNISITKGLINNSVWGITQDKDGYMWFASSNGIQRFDGKNYKSFSQRDGLADSEALDFFRNNVTDSKKEVPLFCVLESVFSAKRIFLRYPRN